MKIKVRYLLLLVVWSALAASMCMAAQMSAARPLPDTPVVYVSNFELDVSLEANSQTPHGLLGGRLGLLRQRKNPQTEAQEMISLMADTLTKDLKEAGIDARRVLPGTQLPKKGWYIHGVFLSIDQGNVARRAIIGFGAGRSNLQVAVALDDLAAPEQPPLQVVAGGSGSRMPGAIVMLNPYAIAAKVVLAGRDQNKAIKDAAKQIAHIVVQRVKANVPKSADEHVSVSRSVNFPPRFNYCSMC